MVLSKKQQLIELFKKMEKARTAEGLINLAREIEEFVKENPILSEYALMMFPDAIHRIKIMKSLSKPQQTLLYKELLAANYKVAHMYLELCENKNLDTLKDTPFGIQKKLYLVSYKIYQSVASLKIL